MLRDVVFVTSCSIVSSGAVLELMVLGVQQILDFLSGGIEGKPCLVVRMSNSAIRDTILYKPIANSSQCLLRRRKFGDDLVG